MGEQPPYLPSLELTTLTVDGREHHAALIWPRARTEGRRDPVLVDVYGGPHVSVVKATPWAYLLDHWLADTGFVVVRIDGRGTPGRGRAWERAIARDLATVPLAIIARMTRSSLLEVLGQEYITTARSKGLNEWVVVTRHALRNALIPILTIGGLQFGLLLGGAILTETIFSWPGLGRLLYNAVLGRDYPIVQGGTLLIATTFSIINLLVDILYMLVNPRIRYE